MDNIIQRPRNFLCAQEFEGVLLALCQYNALLVVDSTLQNLSSPSSPLTIVLVGLPLSLTIAIRISHPIYV